MVVGCIGEKCGGCGLCRGEVWWLHVDSVEEKCGGCGLCRGEVWWLWTL